MKVLFVSEFYAPHVGGGEVLVQRLAEELARRGHGVTVVTARLPDTGLREEVNGVSIRRVPCPRPGARYFFTLTALPLVARLAASADLVHTIPYNAAPPAWLASALAGTPRVITVLEVLGARWHLFRGRGATAWFHRLAEYCVVRLPFGAHVCISAATRSDLVRSGVDPAVTSVIYCGVDRELFAPRPESRRRTRAALGFTDADFSYLYFGRPGMTKGLRHLVAAVPEIARRIRGARAVFILARDPAPEYRRVMRDIAALAAANRPLVMDPVPRERLPDYIAAADCVVIPSLTEGFGLSAAEACAMEVPVVATSAGALPEVVSGRFVLVEPGSSAALAAGVEKIKDGDYRSSPPRTFTWERAVDDYLRLYGQVIRAHRGPRAPM